MSEPLRILHIVPTLAVGGAEQLALHLARFTDRGRVAFHVAALKHIGGPSLEAEFASLGQPLYFVNSPRFYNPGALAAVAAYVRRERIQIIHTQLLDTNVIGRVVGALTGRAVVTTLANEPGSYGEERPDRRWIERATMGALPSQLVAVSEHIRRLFISEWGIAPERITTINNAVPVQELLRIEPGVRGGSSDGPVITNVGRLSQQKGQRVLLEAARLVLARRPDARFQIVGQGPLEQPLRAHAEALGIADRVSFTGVSFDIPSVLAQTDVFALSSLWEGLPLAAVEAMAAARPVVLTDVGGNRDLVEPGVQGLIVPPGDGPALAAALLNLLDNPGQRVSMGLAARERVRHDFAIETVARRYEALYDQICGARSGRLGYA